MQVPKVAAYPEFLWSQPDTEIDGRVAGRKAVSTSQMPAGGVIFGRWSDAMIASWAGAEILVNPFVRAIQALLPTELVSAPEIVEPWIAERCPIGRSGFPADIANAALWLASSESSFVIGHALVVDGGITAGRRWSEQQQSYERFRERFGFAVANANKQREACSEKVF